MKKLLWTIITLAGFACAQDPNQPTTRVIELKYADARRVAALTQVQGATYNTADPNLHYIRVSGPLKAVDEYEAAARKLDIPPLNVELTVYMLSGNSQSTTDDIPKDLAPTIKQLHGLFSYKSYRVMQSFLIRSRDGQSGRNGGSIPNSNAEYNFNYGSASVSGGPAPRIIRIDHLFLSVQTPTGQLNKDKEMVWRTASIGDDVDVREGQQVVVGKSSMSQTTDEALILVISAKIIE